MPLPAEGELPNEGEGANERDDVNEGDGANEGEGAKPRDGTNGREGAASEEGTESGGVLKPLDFGMAGAGDLLSAFPSLVVCAIAGKTRSVSSIVSGAGYWDIAFPR